MPTELICPKCRGAMRSYERNRVTIDQCVECRGIFLDRGELEALLDAEAAYNRPAAPVQQSPGPIVGGYGYEGDHHGSGRSHSGQPKRRKSFLGELFD